MGVNGNGQYLATKQAVEDEENDFLADFDLEKFLWVVRRSIIWVVLIFALCIFAVFIALRYVKKIYQSDAIIQLEAKGTAPTLGLGIFKDESSINDYLVGETEFIMSNKIKDEVINILDLYVSYWIQGRFIDDEKFNNSPFKVTNYEVTNYDFFDNKKIYLQMLDSTHFALSYEFDDAIISKTYRFGERIKDENFSCTINLINLDLQNKYFFIFQSHSYLQSYIGQNLSVFPMNVKARTIGIVFREANKYKAAAIVNAINEVYLKKSIDNKNLTNKQQIQYLEEQLDTLTLRLEEYDAKIDAYKRGKGEASNPLNLEPTLAEILNGIKTLHSEKIKLNEEIKKYKDVVDFLSSDSSYQLINTVAMGIADGRINQKINQLDEVQKELKRISDSYREPSFALQQKQKKLEEIREELLELISFNKFRLYDKVYQIDVEIRKLENKIPNGSSDMDLELRRLNRYYASYENNYNILLSRIVELGIAEAGTVASFQVLSKASIPQLPIYPIRNTFYLYGLIAALGLSIALIIIRYLLLNKITNLKEVEKFTKAPILGMIPYYSKFKMENSQLVVNINPKSSMSEAMRSIRTNLDFMTQKQHKRIITVTSTVSGEGKTFVAVNLAGIIALSQTKVVVLDLDLRKPKVHLAFGAENFNGVSNILIGKASVEECIKKSEIENLHYITAGPHPPNPSELIMSSEFKDLIKELHQTYDLIICDTPPVGIVTDGLLVMKMADVPIYVLRSAYSKKIFISNLNKLISANNFNRLSVVLNGVGKAGTYGYGYGYGYRYGYGYGYGYGGYGNSYGYYDDTPAPTLLEKIKHIFAKQKLEKDD